MPRQPRLEIPGIPVHVTQRGVNRCAVFLDDDDRQHYLKLLAASAQRHALQIHAYVLMGNHVHLLISSEKAGALSKAMRQVGQNYDIQPQASAYRYIVGGAFQVSLGRFESLSAYGVPLYRAQSSARRHSRITRALPVVKCSRQSGFATRSDCHSP